VLQNEFFNFRADEFTFWETTKSTGHEIRTTKRICIATSWRNRISGRMSRYADHLPCIVGRAPTRVDNDVVRNELDVHVSLRGSTWLGEGVDKRTDQRSFLAVAVVHVEDIATEIGSEVVEFDGHILQCSFSWLTCFNEND